MKLSVTSYSFMQLLQANLHTQYSLIALAKTMGFDSIEFTDLTPPAGLSQRKYARKMRAELDRLGMTVASYSVGGQLLNEGEVERLCEQVDVAEILGAKVMRHDVIYQLPDWKKTYWDYLDKIADGTREVTRYAESKGIRTCTENHGFICQDADRVKALIERVNHPNYGWLLDIGNFLCTDGDPIESVKVALPYVFHVHLKDFDVFTTSEPGSFSTPTGKILRGAVPGQGVVPVRECVKLIRDSGYDGYYTVEYEGPQPCLEAIQQTVELMRSLEN